MYKEGKAAIKYTKDSFLNPDALISRDISIAYVAAFADKKSSILDATSATGIRGIRYYLETKSRDVTLLEMNEKSFISTKKNVAFNKVKVKALGKSIQEFANSTDKKFDFIDLDPFGGVGPYVYDLMKISRSGTHLMITATDTAVLCGADYKACLRLYDARPMHNDLCQEVGLRLLIGYVARIAAQFNFGIEVNLSFSYLHYMRVFLQLHHGSKNALETIKNMGYVYYCNNCMHMKIEKSFLSTTNKCERCGNIVETAGKVWLGDLYNNEAVAAMIAQMKDGYSQNGIDFLTKISKEEQIPLYYSIPRITGKMGIGAVSPNKVIDALVKKGFIASKTHLDKSSIKTDADIEEVKLCIRRAQ
jgi:tRNA (guanine26-N2/guanine27-N2)-dimethyltransferase